MRESGYSDSMWLMDGDVFVGVLMAGGYCAEHEEGVSGLHDLFGIENSRTGLGGRTATKVPDARCVYVNTRLKEPLLVVYDHPWWQPEEDAEKYQFIGKRSISALYKDRTWASAWDKKSFGIKVAKEHVAKLNDLVRAFERKDIAIWTGGGQNPFGRAGLVVAIASRVPEDKRKVMLDTDNEYIRLHKAAEDTQVHSYIRERVKSPWGQNDVPWYALSPGWKPDSKESAWPVWFFLNPKDQHRVNYGWFTVEELIDWADGKGPVLKTSPGR